MNLRSPWKLGRFHYRNFKTSVRDVATCSIRRNSSFLPTLLLGSTILAVSFSLPHSLIECQDSSNTLKGSTLVTELNKKLKSVRDKLLKLGKPTPELIVSTHNDFTEVIFELDKNCNVSSLVSRWSIILMKPGSSSPSYHMSKGLVEIMSSDRKAKLTWREDKLGHVVSIKRHVGFSPADVDALVSGHEDVMISFRQSSKSNNDGRDDSSINDGFVFSFQRHPDPFDDFIPRDFRDIFEQFSRMQGSGDWSEFDEFSESDGSSSSNPRSQGTFKGSSGIGPAAPAPPQLDGLNKSNGGSPVDKLQAMGLVVYDPKGQYSGGGADNAKSSAAGSSGSMGSASPPVMSWDSLAGYDDVKQQIEDTVINAFKYGETYDAIIRKTRVDFESNRPKAILLEGPPGTGKTLTARILASKCERPLVILQIDKIVSKWYGDSEKTLAKVNTLYEHIEF